MSQRYKQFEAGRGKARQGEARLGMARQGKAKLLTINLAMPAIE